jgi:hypothetical protein
MTNKSRGVRAAYWIEQFCVIPAGPEKGQRVKLSQEQRDTVIAIYEGSEAVPVSGPLAAYLALLHVCGPEALLGKGAVPFETDLFTVWGATGPALKEVLRRERDQIVCGELGTCYPPKAAA